jgi:hypothetical protein
MEQVVIQACRQGRVMLKNSYRSISAVLLAALVAGAITVLPGASDKVSASAPLNSGKGDRLDIRPLGAKCSEQAWPNFEAGCLRDKRQAMGQVKAVRTITTDRVAAR